MKIKKLSECQLNKSYLIFQIDIQDKKIRLHLKNLMIKEKEKIILKRKNYGCKTFIVSVLGINYAIGREVCDGILVYDV